MIKAILKVWMGAAICMLATVATAQNSGQLGSFDLLPQSVYANPALRPAGKLNIGIPALSGVNLEHGNNWFSPNDYLVSDGNGRSTIDAQSVLNNIDEAAITNQTAGIELIHVGLRIKKHYFHVRAAERVQFGIELPRDIFALAVYGNVGDNGFDDYTADFSGLGIDGIHYREYGIGWNYEINDKWSVGLTAKYLYGMERIQTAESSLKLRTDPNTYELQSSGVLEVNTSGVYSAIDDDSDGVQSDMGTYLTGLKNTGFGGDLGVVYKPIEKLQLEVSANDLGFIKWKTDIANYRTGDAGFAYNGIDLTDFIFETESEFDDGLENELDSLLDDLEEVYEFERTTESFKTSLNGYMRYAATYSLYETEKFEGKVWANAMHGLGESQTPFTFTVGYNQKCWRNIQASVHYSKRSQFKGSFGCGLVLAAGPVQFYVMAESIQVANMTKVNIVDEDDGSNETTITYFSNPNDLRLNFGFNLAFKGKDSKKSGRKFHN